MAPEQVLLSPAILERKEKPLNDPGHLYLKETTLYINIKRWYSVKRILGSQFKLTCIYSTLEPAKYLCFLYGWSFGAKWSAPRTGVDMLLSDGLFHSEPHCIQDVQTRIDYMVL